MPKKSEKNSSLPKIKESNIKANSIPVTSLNSPISSLPKLVDFMSMQNPYFAMTPL
jgi:hypothetical protein